VEDTTYFGGVPMTILYCYFSDVPEMMCVEQGESTVHTQGAGTLVLIPSTKNMHFTRWCCLILCLRSFFSLVASFFNEGRGKEQLFKLIFLDETSMLVHPLAWQTSLERICISKKYTLESHFFGVRRRNTVLWSCMIRPHREILTTISSLSEKWFHRLFHCRSMPIEDQHSCTHVQGKGWNTHQTRLVVAW
jgi:hypothetical protein